VKRAPNVIELDPGLRAFLRSERGREVKKRGDLALVVERARSARRWGTFRSKAGVLDAWKIEAFVLDSTRKWARESPDQFREPAMPQYEQPAEVILLRARAGQDELTAGAR
jgi:hypothetical protein